MKTRVRFEVAESITAESMPVHLIVDPNGDRFYVTMPQEDRIGVYDTVDRKWEQSISTPSYPGHCAISRDGDFLITANYNDESLFVVDLRKGCTYCLPAGRYPRSVVLSDDSLTAAAVNFHVGTVSLVEFVNRTPIERTVIKVGPRPVAAAFFARPKALVIVDGQDGSLYYVEVETERVTRSAIGIVGGQILSDSDRDKCFVSSPRTGEVLVIDRSGCKMATIRTGGRPVFQGMLSDRKHIYVVNGRESSVVFIDMAMHKVVASTSVDGFPLTAFEIPGFDLLLVVARQRDRITAIDTYNYKVIASISVGRSGYWLGYSKRCGQVYMTNEGDQSISVLRLALCDASEQCESSGRTSVEVI